MNSTPPPADASEVWNDSLLRNPHAVADKRSRVKSMFAAIAPSYDLNNRVHSLGVDQWWRRRAVAIANLSAGDRVVDVACGTGDLTRKFAHRLAVLARRKQGERISATKSGDSGAPDVLGIDFTYEMLPLAVRKLRIDRFFNGDAMRLPLADACCDVVSIAFGIRNVADPLTAFREFRRVLRPEGRLVVLEFSLPTNRMLRGLYNLYFRQILPRTATLISGDKTGAYRYLPESVNTFIGRQQMADMMAQAGFSAVTQHSMTFGVCICYRGIAADEFSAL